MKIPDIVIAVDGYSSTGKSTFAKLVAKEFGFLYLDSGALYRGVTLFALEQGLIEGTDKINTSALIPLLDGIDLRFDAERGTCIGDRCIESEIRTLRVSNSVSPIATIPAVRNFVDSKLHEFGRRGRIIMDGRDIGTTVFPDAELKIFVTASAEVRAQRRFDELKAKGMPADFDDILKNVQERDYIDSHREVSPLRKADDAIELDNSNMTIAEQKEWLMERFRERTAQ